MLSCTCSISSSEGILKAIFSHKHYSRKYTIVYLKRKLRNSGNVNITIVSKQLGPYGKIPAARLQRKPPTVFTARCYVERGYATVTVRRPSVRL